MKMTVKAAEERFGHEVIEKLAAMAAEPTSRLIYPAFEPEHAGLDEYVAGGVSVPGGNIYAYYFQPSDAEGDWEYGVTEDGTEYGEIDNIEFIED